MHGTDNARCLIALALITGQIGRPGSGLHPLRGQNNVQGASDAGLIPMVYADYQPVEDQAVRRLFEAFWGLPLDPKRGLTVVEIMDAIHKGAIRGMYIEGENPAMSDPDLNHARKALATLDPRSRRIVEARWLHDGDGATLHDLAAEFAVSAERIRQIEAKALQKMRGALTAA